MSLPYSASIPAETTDKRTECLNAGDASRVLLENDIKRYTFFSNGFVSLYTFPDNRTFMTDVRYSPLPWTLKPLWAMNYNIEHQEVHARMAYFRRIKSIPLGEYWQAITGEGVFAKKSFNPNNLIELAPALVIPKDHVDTVNTTSLIDYVFEWGDEGDSLALALGFGSLYNHSYNPNAYYLQDFENGTFEFYTLRKIEKGEEITINYNGEPEDLSPLWFETAPVS